MKNAVEEYYDDKYFATQGREFNGRAELFKFKEEIKPNDAVLDFGCSGGYLLECIKCKTKYGVEINDTSRAEALKKGITCVERIAQIPDDSIDVVISNHCLEHVINPFETLVELKRVLKKGGKIIFVVPCENSLKIRKNDEDHHLYTWTPQNFYNLFIAAGYTVLKVEALKNVWPPKPKLIQKIFGWKMFYILSHVYSVLRRSGYQTKIIAKLEQK